MKINYINVIYNDTCECCGGANNWVLASLLMNEKPYTVCSNCLVKLVNLDLSKEEFISLIEWSHGEGEFLLHEDFYEHGVAQQPRKVALKDVNRTIEPKKIIGLDIMVRTNNLVTARVDRNKVSMLCGLLRELGVSYNVDLPEVGLAVIVFNLDKAREKLEELGL